MSYPLTGSTGDGYVMARQAGHTVTPLRPSLVPLVSEDGWCGEAQGLSLRNCAVRVEDTIKNKIIYQDFGEILFTHFGVSGPIALSASAHMDGMRPGRYRLLIDLKPALTEEQLDLRLIRDFERNKTGISPIRWIICFPVALPGDSVSFRAFRQRRNAIPSQGSGAGAGRFVKVPAGYHTGLQAD